MNEKDKVRIMEIDFLNKSKADFLQEFLFPRLNKEKRSFVVTANPEIVMKARDDEVYKRIIQSADFVVPDGAGIVMAAKLLKQPLKERIPGYDLTLDLLTYADENNLSCYFLGAAEQVNEKVVKVVEKKYPKITIAGHHHGFFKMDDPKIVEQIKESAPDIIFVALGFPRQEEWIAKHIEHYHKGLFIGIGGSFDVLAGEVKRAPDIWIKLNLEWLYRIIKQPFRAKRILKVFEFMFRIVLRKY